MRILALDWGKVRVGAAISDETGTIAQPLDKFINAKQAISEIKKLVTEYNVEKIIIGLPKSMSGEEGKSAVEARKFGTNLETETKLKIEYLDERLTTVDIDKRLRQQGVKSKNSKTYKDNLTAALILESYLNQIGKKH